MTREIIKLNEKTLVDALTGEFFAIKPANPLLGIDSNEDQVRASAGAIELTPEGFMSNPSTFRVLDAGKVIRVTGKTQERIGSLFSQDIAEKLGEIANNSTATNIATILSSTIALSSAPAPTMPFSTKATWMVKLDKGAYAWTKSATVLVMNHTGKLVLSIENKDSSLVVNEAVDGLFEAFIRMRMSYSIKIIYKLEARKQVIEVKPISFQTAYGVSDVNSCMAGTLESSKGSSFVAWLERNSATHSAVGIFDNGHMVGRTIIVNNKYIVRTYTSSDISLTLAEEALVSAGYSKLPAELLVEVTDVDVHSGAYFDSSTFIVKDGKWYRMLGKTMKGHYMSAFFVSYGSASSDSSGNIAVDGKQVGIVNNLTNLELFPVEVRSKLQELIKDKFSI